LRASRYVAPPTVGFSSAPLDSGRISSLYFRRSFSWLSPPLIRDLFRAFLQYLPPFVDIESSPSRSPSSPSCTSPSAKQLCLMNLHSFSFASPTNFFQGERPLCLSLVPLALVMHAGPPVTPRNAPLRRMTFPLSFFSFRRRSELALSYIYFLILRFVLIRASSSASVLRRALLDERSFFRLRRAFSAYRVFSLPFSFGAPLHHIF